MFIGPRSCPNSLSHGAYLCFTLLVVNVIVKHHGTELFFGGFLLVCTVKQCNA